MTKKKLAKFVEQDISTTKKVIKELENRKLQKQILSKQNALYRRRTNTMALKKQIQNSIYKVP